MVTTATPATAPSFSNSRPGAALTGTIRSAGRRRAAAGTVRRSGGPLGPRHTPDAPRSASCPRRARPRPADRSVLEVVAGPDIVHRFMEDTRAAGDLQRGSVVIAA